MLPRNGEKQIFQGTLCWPVREGDIMIDRWLKLGVSDAPKESANSFGLLDLCVK